MSKRSPPAPPLQEAKQPRYAQSEGKSRGRRPKKKPPTEKQQAAMRIARQTREANAKLAREQSLPTSPLPVAPRAIDSPPASDRRTRRPSGSYCELSDNETADESHADAAPISAPEPENEETRSEHESWVVDDLEQEFPVATGFFPGGAPFEETQAPDSSSEDSSSSQCSSDDEAEDYSEDSSDFESYDHASDLQRPADTLNPSYSQPSTVQAPAITAASGVAKFKQQLLDLLDSCQLPEEQKKGLFTQFCMNVLLGS